MKVIDDFAYRLADNLALMFGDKCEVVIHDFSKGLDQTIVKLCNGHVTNREVGACPPGSFWEKVGSLETATDLLPYFKHTEDGRIIKTNATLKVRSLLPILSSMTKTQNQTPPSRLTTMWMRFLSTICLPSLV